MKITRFSPARTALALGLVAALGLSATQAGHSAKRVVLAIPLDEGTLTPLTVQTGYPGYNLMSLVYDTLMLNDANGVPQPWLAETVSNSNGGRTWTIKLRDGVKWQDGKPLTSADVKFSYEYYRTNVVDGGYDSSVRPISAIGTPDARTVILSLPKPEATFQIATLAYVPILPRHVWEGVTDPKSVKNSIGSGPYKLAEYKPDQSYRLVENPDYFGGKPGVDELILTVIPDTTATFQALQAGQVSAATREVSPELIPKFSSDPKLKVVRGPGFATTMLQFNTTMAPFNAAAFRRVVAGLIDVKGLVDTVLLGNGTPGSAGFVHPASAYYSPSTREYQRLTPEGAGRALDALGYRAGADGVRVGQDGKRLEFTLLAQANNPLRIRAAELIAQQVKPAGIVLNVKSLDFTTVQQMMWPEFDVAKGRNFEIGMWGWSGPVQLQAKWNDLFNSNPEFGSLNIGGYKNPTVDALTQRLTATVDPAAFKTLAGRLQSLIAQELPFVTLWYADGVYAYRPEAYDGWKFVKGQGIVNKRSMIQ